MSMTVTAIAKAALTVLTDEKARKRVGWILAAVLSPFIVLFALLCAILSGTSSHNVSTVELCFHGGTIPSSVTPEYRRYIEDMRDSFDQLDDIIDGINALCKDGESLDGVRVKAVFYSLYFELEQPDTGGLHTFADCFVEYTETYTAAVAIKDLDEIYQNISSAMGIEATAEQRSNADSIYNLILYGSAGGETDGWFPGADSPYIGVDGFCSPVGENWASIVTSEFGHRTDPITGVASGHSGMDLAVPTGTPIRAALPGTVTVSKYHSSYGYYVVIEQADGLSTLYAHNSSLLALVGQTVEAGDIISLSGSTGRSTGPHLHFEVKVNGERTNPRYYLPKAES